MKYLSILPFLAFATACTMAPEYERPELQDIVAETYAGIAATSPDETAVTRLGWSEFFADERLKALIRSGLAKNRDLRVAILTVEQVRAQYDIQWADLLPDVYGEAAWTRARTNKYLSITGEAYTANTFEIGAAASYEVDLWGRVRSLTEQAFEQWVQAAENERAVRISLVAQIATQYYTLELAKERLAISEQSLATTKKWLDQMESRYRAGTVTEIDYMAAKAQYQSVVSATEQLRETQKQAVNALALLVGETELPQVDAPALSIADANLLKPIDAGIPSLVLVLRPDVLSAERALRAANANIGAARAAFFPTITLTASGGIASADLDDLFTGDARTWSFSPSIYVPIFDYFNGRLEAQLDVAELQKEIEIANYEKAIQTAFREVADELVIQESINRRLESDEAALQAQKRRYELTELNYQDGNGVIDYTDVLLAQNDYFDAEQTVVQTRFTKIASMISLYKALGGGWAEESVPEGEKVPPEPTQDISDADAPAEAEEENVDAPAEATDADEPATETEPAEAAELETVAEEPAETTDTAAPADAEEIDAPEATDAADVPAEATDAAEPAADAEAPEA